MHQQQQLCLLLTGRCAAPLKGDLPLHWAHCGLNCRQIRFQIRFISKSHFQGPTLFLASVQTGSGCPDLATSLSPGTGCSRLVLCVMSLRQTTRHLDVLNISFCQILSERSIISEPERNHSLDASHVCILEMMKKRTMRINAMVFL